MYLDITNRSSIVELVRGKEERESREYDERKRNIVVSMSE
jgi:hypothetical protein